VTDPSSSDESDLYPDVPYEYGAIAAPGALLFTAGACPLNPLGEIVGDDPSAQAVIAMENLGKMLARYGGRLDQVVKSTVYVVGDRADLVAVWRVVEERFSPRCPPSTLLGVAALGFERQLVEIEAVAAIASGDHH
jgi:enamine deaminase RidA (YjgF/YER057c/UK114 family)